MSSLSRRIIAPCSEIDGDNATVDVDAIVRRVLLFDEYLMESRRLLEFAPLVSLIGPDQVVALLTSGAVKIHCDLLSVGEIGSVPLERQPPPAEGSLRFSPVGIDRTGFVDACLRGVAEALSDLDEVQRARIAECIEDALIPIDHAVGSLATEQLALDLGHNSPLCRASLQMTVQDELGEQFDGAAVELRLEQTGERDFRFQTNLAEFGIDPATEKALTTRALLSIGGLNLRFAYMREYSAVTGFDARDVALFDERLSLVLDEVAPGRREERFRRVIDLLELPTFEQSDGSLDVDALLAARDSPDCREFRDWLAGTDGQSDDEIHEQVESFRTRVAGVVHRRSGRAVRFLTTTAIGFLPVVGGLAGATVGAIDEFVLDRVLPYSGVASFVGDRYPRIYGGG